MLTDKEGLGYSGHPQAHNSPDKSMEDRGLAVHVGKDRKHQRPTQTEHRTGVTGLRDGTSG